MLFCVFTSTTPSFALEYEDFTYEFVDEKIVITGYTGSDIEITIPAEIDGLSVVKIEDNAFKDNENLASVTVSEGVEDIGESAFQNCTSLATISLPETIIHFGKNAIFNTAYYNDKDNWKPKKTSSGSTSDGVDMGSGSGGVTINWEDIAAQNLDYLYLDKILIRATYSGSYSVKYDTRVIADGAFEGNDGAIGVGLSAKVVAIGNNAFYGCERLETISNLDKVDYIGDGAFVGCLALDTINISQSVDFKSDAIYNTGFYNNPENWENNALYLDTRLVATKGTEAITKDGTTTIISGAVTCEKLLIPATVTSIHKNAFTNVENTTILGYADTYAETFASENNIEFIALDNLIMGDVNFNGVLDNEDYEILCEVSTLVRNNSYLITFAGDMNEDGTIDGFDIVIFDLFFNNIGPSTIKGDADGNGKVNEEDYALLVKITTLNSKITDVYMFDRCDLNGDGAVDSLDALYLDLALNGLVAIM